MPERDVDVVAERRRRRAERRARLSAEGRTRTSGGKGRRRDWRTREAWS